MKHSVYMIVATDPQNGIGMNGKMPWNLKDDMRFFKEVTTKTQDSSKKNMVIMGRTTWDSIPENHRPLADRVNIVLSRNEDFVPEGAMRCSSIHEALELADEAIETCFIIGGGSVYHQFINDPLLTGVYITRINKRFNCDTFFPEVPEHFSKVASLGKVQEGDLEYEYLLYEKEA